MPSRSDVHTGHHESVYADQKPLTHQVASPKSHCDHVTRQRPRRTRFVSGGGGGTEANSNSPEEIILPRSRRYSNVHIHNTAVANIPRHSRSHPKHPGSLPTSPNTLFGPVRHKTTTTTAIIIDSYVPQNDSTVNRVEQLEDDNSFSSSVFSEHLAAPDLPIVINSVPRDVGEKGKIRRGSILSTADGHLLQDDDDDEDDDENPDTQQAAIGREIKADMAGLLIHEDSGISTPTMAVADDAGSSEGEDDNDGKDQVLIQSTEAMDLTATQPIDGNAVSDSEPALLVNSCGTADRSFIPEDLAVLNGGPFTCVQNTGCVDNNEVQVHNILSIEPTIVSPATPEAAATTSNTQLSTSASRMMTRSQRHTSSTVSSPMGASWVATGVCSFNATVSPSSHHSKRVNGAKLDGRVSPAIEAHTCSPSICNLETIEGATLSNGKTYSTTGVLSNLNPLIPDQLSHVDLEKAAAGIPFWLRPAVTVKSDASVPTINGSVLLESSLPRDSNSSCSKMCVDSPMLQSPIDTPSPNSRDHPYPLRSRLRRDSLRKQWHLAQAAPKSFNDLPTEVLFRIAHYLSIQDVFRLQMVNYRLKAIVERYLLLVKRINFSNGLPFAFLPETINDGSLKRILVRTPEVTHILGFYPKRIAGSHPADCLSLGSIRSCPANSLTYAGIVSAFRICPRLRSVELMDVELMSKLVNYLPRIKFHGMFRNRPDSWDCEYAVPLPPESPTISTPVMGDASSTSASHPSVDSRTHNSLYYSSSLFCSVTAVAAAAEAASSHSKSKLARLADAFDVKRLSYTKCLSSFHLLDSVTTSPRARGSTVKTSPSCYKQSSSSNNPSTHLNSLFRQAACVAQNFVLDYAPLASWFEPLGECPIGQGSPSTVPHFLPTRPTALVDLFPWSEQLLYPPFDPLRGVAAAAPFLQPGLPPIEAELITAAPIPLASQPGVENPVGLLAGPHAPPIMALAFGAVYVSPALGGPHAFGAGAAPVMMLVAPPGLGGGGGGGAEGLALANQHQQQPHVPNPFALPMPAAQFRQPLPPIRLPAHQQDAGAGRAARRPPPPVRPYPIHRPSGIGRLMGSNSSQPWFVSPLPSHSHWVGLPHAITNLTKLDLVSVAVSAIPRMDNIKYLHLKWVVFASADPFLNFSATKLQSFVMNNCSGPSRVIRFVRIFSALARAPQLTRLELVGIRFVDGLLAHIIDAPLAPGRGFRNLQRLVLSSNRDATEFDVGLLLLAGQYSLNHVALQIGHTRNSLFESLMCAQTSFPRLENLILGYQDPYQSRLTISELLGLGIGESPDHLMPVCGLTDWGMSFMFHLCPRLTSLTVRHAPYLSHLASWFDSSLSSTASNDGDSGVNGAAAAAAAEQQGPAVSVAGEARPAVPPSAQADLINDGQVMESDGSARLGMLLVQPPAPSLLNLRSLTLENCPGISIESLSEAINTGYPFPCLEALVLRDMFMPRCTSGQAAKPSFKSNPFAQTTSSSNVNDGDDCESQVWWSRVSHLQAIADLLASRRLGYSSSTNPEGVGLASSVRDVVRTTQATGTRTADVPYSLRTHHYYNSLLELDGSCGPRSIGCDRLPRVLSQPLRRQATPTSRTRAAVLSDNAVSTAEFVSQSTQTCVCGLLEWHVLQQLTNEADADKTQCGTSRSRSSHGARLATGSNCPPSTASTTTPSSHASQTSNNNNNHHHQQQLGGPLAFHPFPPSALHQNLHQLITSSRWSRNVGARVQELMNSEATTASSSQSVRTDPTECPGCASDPISTGQLRQANESAQSISSIHYETSLHHRPRKWIAQDACVDTSELRCHTTPGPLAFTIRQGVGTNCLHSNLTSIHFEKVGISHLVLHGALHLKNITLENCPQLKAILFPTSTSTSNVVPGAEATAPTVAVDTLPYLRRIRVVRCPKFAIYHLLDAVAGLYPVHDENVSITYRPFGQYEERVERALWDRANHAHVLISHDYKQHESERAMEEFHSSFDQLFREVINFADMLVRRELLSTHPKPSVSASGPCGFRRSEHGLGWNIVTDIPWIHEICCSILRSNETRRSEQADQFYEVLSEVQSSSPSNLKLQRRGIHLHVQFRDVHPVWWSKLQTGSQSTPVHPSQSYHNWTYSEQYLTSTSPNTDLNALGDGLDESLIGCLPTCPVVAQTKPPESAVLPAWQQLLLAQEEPSEQNRCRSRGANPPPLVPRCPTPRESRVVSQLLHLRRQKPTSDLQPCKRVKLDRLISSSLSVLGPPNRQVGATTSPMSVRPKLSTPSTASFSVPASSTSRKRPSLVPTSGLSTDGPLVSGPMGKKSRHSYAYNSSSHKASGVD